MEQKVDCPKCGSPTRLIVPPPIDPEAPAADPPPQGPELEVLLDNIRSAENVGAIFRTADGAGVRHLHLSGTTPAPVHPKLAKAALGAEFSVQWTQHWNALQAAQEIRQRGYRLWALESGSQSRPLFSMAGQLAGPPVLLVVGSEVAGVDPEILEVCDCIVSIPMVGIKRSLNVATAFGIAAYFIRFQSASAAA